MPQLDAYVFLSQVFWFLLGFLVLFSLTASVFLPRILKELVVRTTRGELALSPPPNPVTDLEFSLLMDSFEGMFNLPQSGTQNSLIELPAELKEEQEEGILESFSYLELVDSGLKLSNID